MGNVAIKHIYRSLIACLLLLLLTSCSTTKLSYNLAGWWVGWWIRDYVSLDSDQKADFKQDVRTLHQWHRKTQLSQYANFLQDLKATLANPELTAEEVRQVAINAETLAEQTESEIVEPASRLLASLSDEQVAQLLENLQEDLTEFQESHADSDETDRQESREKFMTDFGKTWVGRLNGAQREFIQHWATQIRSSGTQELENRQHWHDRLRAALNERKKNPAEITELTNDYLFNSGKSLTDEYRIVIRHNQQQTYQLVSELMQSLTDKQRRHFNKEIDKLAEDLRELTES